MCLTKQCIVCLDSIRGAAKQREINAIKPSGGRPKKKCPIKVCGAERVWLARHMRIVHNWSDEKAREVLAFSNGRKEYTWRNGPPVRRKATKKSDKKSTKKYPDYHKRKRCPFENCYSVPLRLGEHLKKSSLKR